MGPPAVGSGYSHCPGLVVQPCPALDGLPETVHGISGQPLTTICKSLLGAPALALGHVLTLCHRSRASAQPTRTHTQLGSLENKKRSPVITGKPIGPVSPSDLGLLGVNEPLRAGVPTHGTCLPLRPGVLGTLTVPHTQASWGSMSLPNPGLLRLSGGLLSISPPSDSGLPTRRARKHPRTGSVPSAARQVSASLL